MGERRLLATGEGFATAATQSALRDLQMTPVELASGGVRLVDCMVVYLVAFN